MFSPSLHLLTVVSNYTYKQSRQLAMCSLLFQINCKNKTKKIIIISLYFPEDGAVNSEFTAGKSPTSPTRNH